MKLYVQNSTHRQPCYRWWGWQFWNVCRIFYCRPEQRCLYPFRHTLEKYPYNTECIILSLPKRARLKSRIKMFRLLLKIIWKKGIPIPTGYIMENVWYTENYGVWFQKWACRRAWQAVVSLWFLLLQQCGNGRRAEGAWKAYKDTQRGYKSFRRKLIING